MKFKQKFALLRRNTHSKEVAGQTFTFYPISLPMLFELRSSMEPLMRGLKAMFAKNSTDGTQTVEEVEDPMTGAKNRTTHLGAIDVEMAKFRASQSDAAMKDALEAVLGEKNRLLLGRLLADSLRDEFEGSPSDEDVQAFISAPEMDLPLLVEFLGGFFTVNAKVFGPFAERVKEAVQAKMANLTQENLGQDDVSESASPASESSPESPS